MMRGILIAWNVIAPVVALALACFGHPLVALAVVFSAHAPLLFATLMPNCAWLGPVRRGFATDRAEVWLTIDDGPDPSDTPRVLDLLDRHGARATFFLIGEKAERWPELVRAIIARGHAVGNHTHTHPAYRFWRLGPGRLRREIADCQRALGNLGVRPKLFRAPAGMHNPIVHPLLRRLGLTLVGWSARGYDGRDTDIDRVLARIVPRLRPGAILLVHEATPIAGELLARLLALLDDRGYRCVLPDNVDPIADAALQYQ